MKKRIYIKPQCCLIDLNLQGIVAMSETGVYDIVKDEDAVQLSNRRESSSGVWSHMRED